MNLNADALLLLSTLDTQLCVSDLGGCSTLGEKLRHTVTSSSAEISGLRRVSSLPSRWLSTQHRGAEVTEQDVEAVLSFFSTSAQLHVNINPFKDVDGKPMLELYALRCELTMRGGFYQHGIIRS